LICGEEKKEKKKAIASIRYQRVRGERTLVLKPKNSKKSKNALGRGDQSAGNVKGKKKREKKRGDSNDLPASKAKKKEKERGQVL